MCLTLAGSLITEAVRPAALDPLPEVYTPMGATFSTNFSSWDLAVPGSPSNRMLMSPRRVNPSGSLLRAPVGSYVLEGDVHKSNCHTRTTYEE